MNRATALVVALLAATVLLAGCQPTTTDSATGAFPSDRVLLTVNHDVSGTLSRSMRYIYFDDIRYRLDPGESSTTFNLTPGVHTIRPVFDPRYSWPAEQMKGAFIFTGETGGRFTLTAVESGGRMIMKVSSELGDKILQFTPETTTTKPATLVAP